MESTVEAIDPRSAKRQVHTPVQDEINSAALAVAALDAAIWASIIEFLPVPKDVRLVKTATAKRPWNTEIVYDDALIAEVVATWLTLLNLRLVSKELAALLHPVDNQVWKRLLLQSFDFSVGEDGFNAENHQYDFGLDDPDASQAPAPHARGSRALHGSWKLPKDQLEKHPQFQAMRGRYGWQERPKNYLEEDLVCWSKLGVYHRPSQYGFLTTLQQQPAVDTWPETEDAFTLFGDLVRLLMLPHGDGMETGGEGSDPLFKYLAAPTEAGSSSTYFGFYVMKTLGYVPHFWRWGRGISGEWKGFTEAEDLESAIAEQLRDNGDGGFEDDEDDFEFPRCSVSDGKLLFQNLRQYCRDWRSVCCNKGSDGNTPVFFVGESKSLPHRWIGYVGEKTWT